MPWKPKFQTIKPWSSGGRVLLALLSDWKSLGKVLDVVGLTKGKP
jgi:hypothetical protein